jgi:hypothetical protein
MSWLTPKCCTRGTSQRCVGVRSANANVKLFCVACSESADNNKIYFAVVRKDPADLPPAKPVLMVTELAHKQPPSNPGPFFVCVFAALGCGCGSHHRRSPLIAVTVGSELAVGRCIRTCFWRCGLCCCACRVGCCCTTTCSRCQARTRVCCHELLVSACLVS